MNSVYITGGKSVERDRAFALTVFALEELLPRYRTLNINIKIKKLDDAFGFCEWEETNLNPREFNIEIARGMSEEDFDKTLLHELVHVKQYAKGELKERYAPKHTQLWKGKDHGTTKYDDQPWEKEAHKLEDKLYNKFYG